MTDVDIAPAARRVDAGIKSDALALLDYTARRQAAGSTFDGLPEHHASLMGYHRQCDALDLLIARGYATHRLFQTDITDAGRAWMLQKGRVDDH